MSTVHHEVGSFRFEWDSVKAESNRRKHGVSFEEAATVFLDPLGRWMDDPDDAKGEVRLVLLGTSLARRALVVVHLERAEVFRIISARLATRRERATLDEES